ncbi:MAG TPA: NAD-dependent succinate-semialdehyde dehydrogenase [Candidatus Acidoferrum sp.]|nr:NAD-dependent succinate-semialdehyde dehydrogenase [Candidatus Acidoferrum sp.]
MKTYPLYLNGEFVASEPAWDVINPATGEPFARISTVDRRRVAQALADAQAAFPGWRQLTAKARGEYLRRIASEVERRRDEIARLISSENGKPLAQSLGEVGMTVDHLTWFAEEGRRAYGRIIPPQAAGKRNIVLKTPIGVVGAISPWNFPLVLAVRKLAPALAAGCPVVLKPARQTPLSCIAFAECCQAAQLPKGVLQVVCGQSNEIGQEFLSNPLCRKVTFTGSTEVGRTLIRGAADTVKPLSLELGGNAPLLVFEDADLKVAVEGAMLAKMRNTGQSCIASNRLLVHRAVYNKFLDAFVAQVKALKVGEFSEPGVEIGPMIDETAFKHAQALVQNAVKAGAKILCGGKQVPRKGYFLEPTVLANVPANVRCLHEEIFAPVAPVTPFDSEEEAVRLANDTPFGLSAYAFTRDVGRVFRLAENLEAGMIGINDGLPTTSNAPFGGVKQSGWGRELGSEGLDAFLETKHISIVVG